MLKKKVIHHTLFYSLPQSLFSYVFLFHTHKLPLQTFTDCLLAQTANTLQTLNKEKNQLFFSGELCKTAIDPSNWILDIFFPRKALHWRIIHLTEMQSGMLPCTKKVILDMTSNTWSRGISAEHYISNLSKLSSTLIFKYSLLTAYQ